MAKYKIYIKWKWKAKRDMGYYSLSDFIFFKPLKKEYFTNKGWKTRPVIYNSKADAISHAKKFYNNKYIEYKIKKVGE